VDIWSLFSQLIAGTNCRLCHAPGAISGLCNDCHAALPHLHHACPRCALPLPQDLSGQLCGECLADPPAFDRACVPLRYAEPVDRLIAHFKYRASLGDGRLLGNLLATALEPADRTIDLIVPLPLHRSRLRERGFNQSAELARCVSHASGIPWRASLLQRVSDPAHQREANRRQRQRNVRNAFVCDTLPPHRHIALLDDVITTGATARAAAAALKRAGAERVTLWALARTPRPGGH
jgi:ComF family protein